MTAPIVKTEQTQISSQDTLKDLMRSQEIQERFEEILGKNARAFLASVLTLAGSDNLRGCEPRSILIAAMKAATLNLSVDPSIAHSYIVPYYVKGKKVAQFQIGYRGFIQLALRTRRYRILNVAPIYIGQEITEDQLTGMISLSGAPENPDNPEIRGYAAYFKLDDGFEKFLYMTLEQINKHAERFSKAYNKEGTPWHTDYDAMCRKTVIKLLLSKYGALSVELESILQEEEETLPEEISAEQFFQELPEQEEPAGEPEQGDDEILEERDNPLEPDREPEQGEPAGEPESAFDPAQFLIAEKLAVDAAEAKQMLQLQKIKDMDPDKLRFWVKNVRAWMDDTGATLNQAAKYVNKGEYIQ